MKPELEGYREFVAEQMGIWKVPGVAVAVVKNGEVAFAEGFGLRNVEAKLPVTPDTIFAIGSASKAFTTMSMGILVDDGRLAWDSPVREYLPTFRLWDPFAMERMTPRDLVTHRSGLPRHDLMWYNNPLSRQALFDRLRYLALSGHITLDGYGLALQLLNLVGHLLCAIQVEINDGYLCSLPGEAESDSPPDAGGGTGY